MASESPEGQEIMKGYQFCAYVNIIYLGSNSSSCSVVDLYIYSLDENMFYRNMSLKLEAVSLDVEINASHCCENACPISQRLKSFNSVFHRSDMSWYLRVRQLKAL